MPVERTPRVVVVRTVGGVRRHGTVTFDVDRNGWVDAEQSTTNRRNGSGDFVEALARGLDVIKSFGPTSMELTVSEVAARTGLPRPTARRLLMTLEQLGYARVVERRVRADDEDARARHGMHRRPGHLGRRPSTHGGAGR